METPITIWMERLLRLAAAAGSCGEIPVAAVVLDPLGRAIGWGSNRREKEQNPLGHAELVALRQASLSSSTWRFNQHTLIVTLEPCPMCAGALVQARMGHVVFGACDPKRGALGSCLDLANNASAHHHMEVTGGVLADQCEELLVSWFRQRRGQYGRLAAQVQAN
jgi:tRNA(adenine34) deaminase